MSEAQIRSAICEVGRRLWLQGLIGGTEGNISAKLRAGSFLITPSGIAKGVMRSEDLVVCNSKGEKLSGEGDVSSEFRLHMEIYSQRKDCMSVVHAHPPVATAFSVTNEDIPDNVLPESALVLGSVATVPFAMPGTSDVALAIRPLLAEHKTFILAHHGACTLGKDVYDAANRIEVLERVCQVLLHATSLGGTRNLPQTAMDYLLSHGLHGRLD